MEGEIMINKSNLSVVCLSLILISTLSSCCRTREEIWDDTQTAGRHIKRGVCSLGGKQGDSKLVSSKDEFYATKDHSYQFQNDYVPLEDLDYQDQIAMVDFVARHAKESPGDPGSHIPGIDSFYNPSEMPDISNIFSMVHFPFDSSLIKGNQNTSALKGIAGYLRSHPRVYIFIEGHCDERGAEAYNLALGAKRANSVRNFLIKEGVSPDNLFTISYGKERPLVLGSNEAAWRENRRAEFKIYVKK